MKLYADMHMHSCLSPCSDDDMTPNNIVNMALLKGLDIIAVTDHNSCANLPAIFQAAKNNGLCVVPGIEVETAEEVHVLAYFNTLEDALAFSDIIYKYIPDIPNNPKFFGNQIITDDSDEIIGEERKLLISPLSLSIEETVTLIRENRGMPVPAHIDRTSHGIISVLGFINPKLNITAVEVSHNTPDYAQYDPRLVTLSSSDAHNLANILEKTEALELKDKSISAFIDYIKVMNEG